MVKIHTSTKKIGDISADCIVIPLHNSLELGQVYTPEIRAQISLLMKKGLFLGEWGRAELFISPKGIASSFIAVVGLGKNDSAEHVQCEGLRRGLATVIMDGRNHLIRNICVYVPVSTYTESLVESALFTDYWFAQHSVAITQDQKARSLEILTLCLNVPEDEALVKKAIQKTQLIMQGVTLARDLVNQPASHMAPSVLVQEARQIAKTSSAISLTVLNRKQALQKKFTAFLAVARGSKEEPYVIHLTYKPVRQAQGKKTLVLIGKGITFDSGGLSLKPAQHMENMKIDMAGAATVLGLFSLLPTLAPDIAVHGIIATCENMPSGDAYRPGDVITAMNGKTIEVLNTDAEGRITLADSLSYAVKLKPDAMVDLATLTGACVVALGDTHAGLFGNNEALNASIMQGARQSGEGLVEFPLPEEYRPTVQSRVADVRNTSMMKMGGAITAALFLQEFVAGIPWAHLDIAGPIYAEVPLIPYWQFGATGYGVRTLVKLVEGFGK